MNRQRVIELAEQLRQNEAHMRGTGEHDLAAMQALIAIRRNLVAQVRALHDSDFGGIETPRHYTPARPVPFWRAMGLVGGFLAVVVVLLVYGASL